MISREYEVGLCRYFTRMVQDPEASRVVDFNGLDATYTASPQDKWWD